MNSLDRILVIVDGGTNRGGEPDCCGDTGRGACGACGEDKVKYMMEEVRLGGTRCRFG